MKKSAQVINAPTGTKSQEDWLTVRETAALLRVHPISVYRACSARHLPHLKDRFVGIRVNRLDLERYLESAKIPVAKKRTAKF